MSNAVIKKIRQQYFPMQLPEGVEAHAVEKDVLQKVMTQLWPAIFPEDSNLCFFRTVQERMGKMEFLWREYYGSGHSETILFTLPDETPIGWVTGDMEDYMTFYLRLFGLLPEYRRKKVFSAFQQKFFEYLKEVGYERIASHHHINNRITLISQLKMGFSLVGFEVDERFGILAKVLYFLHEDRREGYEKVFSMPKDPYTIADNS